MIKPSKKTSGSHQEGGVRTVLLIIIGTVLVISMFARTPSPATPTPTPTVIAPNPIASLVAAQPSSLQPSGELAEIFSFGNDYTDLQRQLKLKEITGKVVQWSLPIYDVKQNGAGYLIQTSHQFKGADQSKKLVGTILYITPQSDGDRRLIEAMKTGDTVTVKGVLEDTTMRSFNIKPAILMAIVEPVAQKPAAKIDDQVASTMKPIIDKSQQAADSPEAITVNFSQETYAELQSILANHAESCASANECVVNGFTFTPVDVDGDDRPEFTVTHRDHCGIGACTTLLMAEGTDHKWNRLASSYGDILVESTSTLGKKDVSFTLKVYRSEGGYDMVKKKFTWSGRKYVKKDT